MDAVEIKKVEPILNELIHESILKSVRLTLEKCTKLKTTAQEPDFVASLAINFTGDLFKILKMAFPENKFSVTGIYCHQKPLVNIGTSKNPELGDLLFVYIYKNTNNEKRFNSILFQAKITSTLKTKVPISDLHQLKLYNQWPEFSYSRAGILNGTKRNIQPKTINNGGQYLLIDNHPVRGVSGIPGTFPIGCSTPGTILSLTNDLATEMINFLIFKAGRQFEEDPISSSDDWTKMIWDLLSITKDKASKRKNIGVGTFARQTTLNLDGCYSFLSEGHSIFSDLHSKFSKSDNLEQVELIDDNTSGLSLILIESIEQSG